MPHAMVDSLIDETRDITSLLLGLILAVQLCVAFSASSTTAWHLYCRQAADVEALSSLALSQRNLNHSDSCTSTQLHRK